MLLVLLLVARGAELVPTELRFETAKPLALHADAPRADMRLTLHSGAYRLGWEGDEITFYRASDMLEVGRMHAATKELGAAKKAGANLLVNKKKVTLTLIMGTQTAELHGELAAVEPAVPAHDSLVGLGDASAASLPSELGGNDDPFASSWARLRGQVQHCSGHAQRLSWGASDPRYAQCVCPIAQDFRMPTQASAKTFRLDSHTRVNLANDAKGKVLSCTLVP